MEQTLLRLALSTLDQVQHLKQITSLDQGRLIGLIREDMMAPCEPSLAELEARLDGLRLVLSAIEQYTERAMAIHLNHALAMSPAPVQLRRLLSATITSYAGDLQLLHGRVAESMARVDPRGGEAATTAIMAAAQAVLGQRQDLRQAIFALCQEVARTALPQIMRLCRDRTQPEPTRASYRLCRVDLETLLQRPERLTEAAFQQRLRTYPMPEDEPVPELPDVRFALLEVD